MRKIREFKEWLLQNEKSGATVAKYLRDVLAFLAFCEVITKEAVLEYKEKLKEEYKPKSVNSILSAVNCYLSFLGMDECKVKLLKLQKKSFADRHSSVNTTRIYLLDTGEEHQRQLEKLNLLLC